MKGKKYKTKYSTIVRKGRIGTCVDIVDNNDVLAYKIEFPNKEHLWFMRRDLVEVKS